MDGLLIGILFAICMLAVVAFQCATEGHKKPKKPEIKNGDYIRITYLPPCSNGQGSPNPYIGMEGIVCDFDGKVFAIKSMSSTLTCIHLKTCKYEKL